MTSDEGGALRRPDDPAFYEAVADLLAPGEINLHGAVVHTGLPSEDETELHQQTIEVGDIVADHVSGDPTETYVYSGNDDSDFGMNQHHGRTLADDAFVWECQQLLRSGTYDIVIYWEASGAMESILSALADAGHDAVGITEDGRWES